MSSVPRIGDLELEQNLKIQHREWTFERIGWICMGLVILAACLGFFGGAGLFLRGTAGSPTSFQIEYDHFARFKAPTMLRATVAPGASDTVRIWLDTVYLRNFQIEQITPEAHSVEAGPDRIVYTFVRAAVGGPLEVTIHVTTEAIGRVMGRGGLISAQGETVRFSQFIYP